MVVVDVVTVWWWSRHGGGIERWWPAQGLACRKERVGDL